MSIFIITTRSLVLGVVFTMLTGSLSLGAGRPNVILCMADDLGWGDTGYNGNTIVKTPHLDAMAREGIRFDRWYAGAPVCSPTRANCLTGRHPLRMGIRTANSGHMLPAEVTLAELLQSHGYQTGHFGKWHLGTLTTTLRDSNRGRPGDRSHFAPPWEHGFQFCFSTEAKVPTYDPMKKPRDTKDVRYGWKPVSGSAFAHYGTHYFDQEGNVVTDNLAGDDSRVMMDRVIPFIRQAAREDTPFFAVVWFHAPHLPVVAGPQHAGLYKQLSWEQQMYYGCISALDEQMGRLREELRSLGLDDNTMLWFSSDNGPENRTPGSTGNLRERKRSLYEGGIRVPGLLVWPAEFPDAKTVHAPCQSGDYFATVVSALGIEPGEQVLDGVDLRPLIEGTRPQRTQAIHFEFGSQSAVIGDRFKLIRPQPDQPWELYDLPADPREQVDLAASHPVIVNRMQSSFEAWQSSRKQPGVGQ